jgi:hypothetical protein
MPHVDSEGAISLEAESHTRDLCYSHHTHLFLAVRRGVPKIGKWCIMISGGGLTPRTWPHNAV